MTKEQKAMDHFGRLIMLNEAEQDAFKRAMIGASYWLDCSPHEQTPEDALAQLDLVAYLTR